MATYYCTVGVGYGNLPTREHHPIGLTGRGYTEIVAPDEETARILMNNITQNKWCGIYLPDEFDVDDYPAGCELGIHFQGGWA